MNHSLRLRTLGLAMGSATLASAAVFAPGAAQASDWKGYSGVNCASQNNTDSVRRSAVNESALANTGTTAVSVYCPVVRDSAGGGDNHVKAVAIRAYNRHNTQNLTCEFSSFNIDGVKIDTRSGFLAPGVKGDIDLGPLNAHNWGSYVLLCQLPGRHPTTALQSYLINYRVDEEL